MDGSTCRDELPAHVTMQWARGEALVAHHEDVVVVRWVGVPSTEQLVALGEAHRAAGERSGDVYVVSVVMRVLGSTSVEPAVYDEMLRLITRRRGCTRAVAHVIEVPSPVGSAVRAFLTTLERIAGTGSTRTATFHDVASAASWIATLRGDPTRGARFVAAWRAMQQAARALPREPRGRALAA